MTNSNEPILDNNEAYDFVLASLARAQLMHLENIRNMATPKTSGACRKLKDFIFHGCNDLRREIDELERAKEAYVKIMRASRNLEDW